MHVESLPLEDLLTHAQWLRGFARALVHEDAEDVAQDSWVAAMRRPPAIESEPRSWLATVARNAARMRFRGDSRRKRREEALGVELSTIDTPADSLHALALQRRLADLVLALEEPHRSTIIHAFYEGLTAAEIGRRQGVPPTTVRSRLRAALEILRAQLDEQSQGDRSAWQMALAPLIPPVGLAPAPGATGGWWTLIAAGLAVAIASVMIALSVNPGSSSSRASSTVTEAAQVQGTSSLPPAQPVLIGGGGDDDPWSSARAVVPSAGVSGVAGAGITGTSDSTIDEPEQLAMTHVSNAVLRANKVLTARFRECYDLARKDGVELRGKVAFEMKVETEPVIAASVEVDENKTTTRNPEFIECVRENTLEIEHTIQSMRDKGEVISGTIQWNFDRELPYSPDNTIDPWPANDAVPACPPGTTLDGAGPPTGDALGCVLADRMPLGPQYRWIDGELSYILIYTNGPERTIQMFTKKLDD